MINDENKKSVEVVEKDGIKYVRLNTNDINLTKMTLVEKVTDVVAAQVLKGNIKVVTKHGKLIETINFATKGDWIIYNIGSSRFNTIIDKMLNCDKKSITKLNFSYLYQRVEGDVNLSSEDMLALIQDLLLDNSDNPEFDPSFIPNLKRYKYIGKGVYAASVPFNFCIKAPWGHDQYIKKGGLIILDNNIEGEKQIYGIEGVNNRTAGSFELNYSIASGTKQKLIADTFKMAIKADRSPIAGIQFNNRDLAMAYKLAHKKMPKYLESILHR